MNLKPRCVVVGSLGFDIWRLVHRGSSLQLLLSNLGETFDLERIVCSYFSRRSSYGQWVCDQGYGGVKL